MGEQQQTKRTDHGLRILAPAKINLSLLVADKRPDGFHEIETIMTKVNWFDEILIQSGTRPGIELVCEGPCWAPAGPDNLVYRACRQFMNTMGLEADLRVILRKNIPAGAGLGSASSDAAATLIGLTEYLQFSLSRRQLKKLAPLLGSDVAFFLGGPLAFCTGRGEKIRKSGKGFKFAALLILPDVSVSTEKVYANFKPDASRYQVLSGRIRDYIEKNRIDLAAGMCANMLETSCFELYRELAKLKAEVNSLGIRPLCLSGSGSAMFWITQAADMQTAQHYRQQIQMKTGCKAFVVSNNRW